MSNPRKHVKYLVAVTSILTALVAARPSVAQGTLLWRQNLSGTFNSFAGASFAEASSLAVDNLGNVVAAGRTGNTGISSNGISSNFTVAKFNPHGTLLWQQNLNGTAHGDDWASSVAVDKLGNVVAAGTTQNTGTGFDFAVAKFNPHGTLLWQQSLNGSANGNDGATSVAVDNLGNVVAAGSTLNIIGPADELSDFTVAKFDGNGTLLWQRNLNGTAISSFDIAYSVAVDNLGNVVAAGITVNTATRFDFTAARFDPHGTLLWQQNLNGTANDHDGASSVAVDNLGNVVAAGGHFTVAKFNR